MKIDRLFGIVCYLLRHDTVSATRLARQFEVSPRTIQRDMNALSVAGIPVSSSAGSQGGYGIMPEYRLGQVATAADYGQLIVAMKALCTADGGKASEQTLNKLMALPVAAQSLPVSVDLSAAREQPQVVLALECIRQALKDQRSMTFEYENALGQTSVRQIEPLRLVYQWYAWYLFAYDSERCDYRLFKLVRMRDVKGTARSFSRQHGDVDRLLAEQAPDSRTCERVRLRCKPHVRTAAEEYLRGEVLCTFEDGSFELGMSMIPSERMAWGLLLSFGDAVEVLEPESLRQRIAEHVRCMGAIYK